MALQRHSGISWIWGRLYASFTSCYSVYVSQCKNQSLPSLFQTRTITEAHRLNEGLIPPTWSLSEVFSNLLIHGFRNWVVPLTEWLQGLASSLISCSTTKVSSRSMSCLENQSANTNNKSVASFQSFEDQDMHPDRPFLFQYGTIQGWEPLVLASAGNWLRSSPSLAAGSEAQPVLIFWNGVPIKSSAPLR